MSVSVTRRRWTHKRLSLIHISIRYTTRMADQGDFVFAVNLAKDQTYSIQLRIRAKGAKVFDAMAREYRPVSYTHLGQFRQADLRLVHRAQLPAHGALH